MLSEYNYHMNAMGCDFDITFITHSTEEADGYFTKSVEVAKFFEQKFSRFDVESELSAINRQKSMQMTREFLDIYAVAVNLYKKTEGKFNPLLQVDRIGYDDSFEKIKNKNTISIDESQYNINMDDIVINEDKFTLQNNQRLDFGGFLKGYVAQRIAYDTEGCSGAVINIGGDLYTKGVDENNEIFVIEIEHPYEQAKNVFIPVTDSALCTSGTYKRKWKSKGENFHHILNDQTKISTKTDIISASVIHKDGAVADAYATYAVSVGSRKAKEFFTLQDIHFVLMCSNGDIMKSDNIK